MSYAQVEERSNHIGDFPEILTDYVGHYGCYEEVMHSLQLYEQNPDPIALMFDKPFLSQVDDSGVQFDRSAFSLRSRPWLANRTTCTER